MSAGRNFQEVLGRWSRLKRERKTAAAAPRPAPARTTPAVSAGAIDFERLDFSSDYTSFLGANVPQAVASRALRKLWMSSDIIARPDELDDYLEDFTEAAMALSPEAARSAYRVGRGLVANEDPTARSGEDTVDVSNTAEHSEELSDGKVAHVSERD